MDLPPFSYHYQNQTYESGFIFDFWSCGPASKDEDGNKFAGAYPYGFLKRVKQAFKEVFPTEPRAKDGGVLHVCAGRTPKSEGYTLDLNPKYNPDLLLNAEDFWLQGVKLCQFDFEIADSPYNVEAARKYYNCELLNKSKMLRSMIATTKVGGFIGILDQVTPANHPKNVKRVALIGVTSVPNRDIRAFTVFRKLWSDNKNP